MSKPRACVKDYYSVEAGEYMELMAYLNKKKIENTLVYDNCLCVKLIAYPKSRYQRWLCTRQGMA